MDATVTAKATPAEFDVLREALATAAHVYKLEADDSSLTSEQRRNARAKAMEIEALLEKLR